MAKIESIDESTLTEAMRTALAEAKAKHGAVIILEAPNAGVQVICQKPSRATYSKYRLERANPDKRPYAAENLFLACLVYPTAKDFEKTLNELPALGSDVFGPKLLEVAGVEEPDAKKG